jgi:hypothetical protein
MLEELACSEESSAIRPRSDWRDNITKGYEIFTKKHKYSPAWQNSVPDVPFENLKRILKTIHNKHATI